MSEVRRIARAVWLLLSGLATSVAGNVGLALLALALALSLWLFVTDRENPTEERAFNSAIDICIVNVPTGLAIARVSQSDVTIRIEAPRNEIDDLREDDFSATIDLGGLSAGSNDVAVDVDAADSDVDIRSVTPARVQVTLEEERTKEVPVRVSLVGSPQLGFTAESERVEPDRVTVRGAQSLVDQVEAVFAEVNLVGRELDLDNERVALVPRDRAGGEISRVRVAPESALVDVNLRQVEFSGEFTVTPRITGAPAPGYNVVSISVDPPIVIVTGDLSDIEAIDAVRGIETEAISIADRREDLIETVSLQLRGGARLDGISEVRVTIDIAPAQGQFSFAVTPLVTGLGEGLSATVAGAITITLTGDVPVLQGVTPSSILLTVDVEGLGPGLHALPIDIAAPAGTTVASIEPAEAGVAIVARP